MVQEITSRDYFEMIAIMKTQIRDHYKKGNFLEAFDTANSVNQNVRFMHDQTEYIKNYIDIDFDFKKHNDFEINFVILNDVMKVLVSDAFYVNQLLDDEIKELEGLSTELWDSYQEYYDNVEVQRFYEFEDPDDIVFGQGELLACYPDRVYVQPFKLENKAGSIVHTDKTYRTLNYILKETCENGEEEIFIQDDVFNSICPVLIQSDVYVPVDVMFRIGAEKLGYECAERIYEANKNSK